MDELMVTGAISLVVFYAGILVVLYGLYRLVMTIVEVVMRGQFLVLGGIVGAIAIGIVLYIILGLYFRKIEII